MRWGVEGVPNACITFFPSPHTYASGAEIRVLIKRGPFLRSENIVHYLCGLKALEEKCFDEL